MVRSGVVLFWRTLAAIALGAAFLHPRAAHATIVGLNQIVTPDIQPTGVLALSAQVEHPAIGNSRQIQAELGVAPRFELAWFQGMAPGEGFFSTEANLFARGPHLLSGGLVNWSTRGGDPQPVLEYGYYTDTDHLVAGGIYANEEAELLLGYRRQLSDKIQLSADFQSGSANSTTVGVVYNFTPSLSLNPAVYWTHSHPHHVFGYVVLTWNITVWK
ncbi:MAG TPA: hypothetical protein VFB27_02430 [Opitutaceae bacterium]|nr:hypothetical protein [Opitutaceae bacterium]